VFEDRFAPLLRSQTEIGEIALHGRLHHADIIGAPDPGEASVYCRAFMETLA
jgi:hypothetical protein